MCILNPTYQDTNKEGGTVAHLAINPDGWHSIIFGDESDLVADMIGLTTAEVDEVIVGGAPPSEHFVACCLYNLPIEFADLFTIIPPATALAVAAA